MKSPMGNQMRNPLMLALDVDSREECSHFAKLLGYQVGAIKLGPRLILRYGATLIQELSAIAPIFVDCKFLDIPSTMDSAVRAAFEAGASFATVHAWAGPDALGLLAKTEAELNQKRVFKILVVSILTSFEQKSLPPPLSKFAISDQVKSLVEMASEVGHQSFVCSPHEVKSLRLGHPDRFLVTPGVRMLGDDAGDQVRIMTPREALNEGASALVIGRSLLKAKDPKTKLAEILESINP